MTELWDFLRGALMSKALAAVVDAGVPEALADGPRPVSELQGDPDTLHRLLRALASDGVFRETEPGEFEPGDSAPYPMKVVVTVPEPGRLRHAWWYGSPGDELQERDVAELELIDS